MPEGWVRSAVAEAVGVFVLCFGGIMAIVNGADLLGVALAHGLAIAVMVAAFGHISGGHFNPAVTLAFLLGRQIGVPAAVVYWVAHLVGATAASALVAWALATDAVALGTPVMAENVGTGTGIVLEAVATLLLVVVVLATVVDDRAPRSVYPFAIGLTITLGVLAIGPLTGAALNPARGFGPALVGGEWSGIAAWLVGPLIGGAVAWALHGYVARPLPAPAGPSQLTDG